MAALTPEEISQILEKFFQTVGTRQYIGARYVPIFGRKGEDSIQWDNTKPYEPLTIVLYQGDSYTSRQYVPVGVDITNELFWALTGNYNAQIEAYRQEVLGYSQRISDVEDTVDEFTAKVDVHTEQLAGSTDSGLKTELEASIANTAHDLNIEIQNVSNDLDTAVATIERDFDTLGGYLAPSYLGDFMEVRQFGACAYHDNKVYTLSPDNYENYGVLRCFDLSSNRLSYTRQVPAGHGNSLCYDAVRDCFWCAPIYSYVNGSSSGASYVYKYDATFANTVTVPLPAPMQFVSFDHITNMLYCGNYAADNTWTIYRMQPDETEFAQYITIPGAIFQNGIESMPWQDCCVNNDVLYLCRPVGALFAVDMNDPTKLIGTYQIGAIDVNGAWKYGEVEGIEFGENGAIYNARNGDCAIKNPDSNWNVNCSFVTTLNTKKACIPSTYHVHTIHGGATLSNANQAKFSLGRGEIRSLAQLAWLLEPISSVTVATGESVSDPYRAKFTLAHTGITLAIHGTLSTQRIEFGGGQLGIYVDANGVLTFTDDTQAPIYIWHDRASLIQIRNRGTINYTNDRFLYAGYSQTQVNVMQLTTPASMKIGDATVTNVPTVCIGNYKVIGS